MIHGHELTFKYKYMYNMLCLIIYLYKYKCMVGNQHYLLIIAFVISNQKIVFDSRLGEGDVKNCCIGL